MTRRTTATLRARTTFVPSLLVIVLAAACGDDAGTRGADDAASTGSPLAAALTSTPTAPSREEFAGAASCQDCHAEQFTKWRASTHGTAGGTPGTPTVGDRVRVIAPFNGAPLRFRDATVIPRQQNGLFSFVVQRPGERDTTITVDAVIGGGHMVGGGTQGFVTFMSDGTQRFLPFDWSRHSNTWFCNTGTRTNRGWLPVSQAMRLADCGDWPPTRVLGDEPRFSNCQACHGSQIDLTFDTTSKRWRTDNNGLSINCESCHGPAARHVRLMRAPGPPAADIGLTSLATQRKDDAVTGCMSCHALKTRLASGYRPGANLTHFYSVLLSQVGDEPLTPDGRTRTFAYQEGHLASACYRDGNMTCTSCHDPHSQGYRSVNGEALTGRFDDRQCTSCHPSKAIDASAHTRHREGSSGSACVACHMSTQQQPELGAAIRYGRSDHTIAIPRPVVDSSMGIVSACRSCHTAKSESQHQAQVRAWWGTPRPHEPAVAGVLEARSVTELARATPLLLQPASRNPIAQVAGLSAWLARFGTPDASALPAEVPRLLRALAGSPDLDVRALALAVLHYVHGHDADTRQFLQKAIAAGGPPPADGDALRRRWATVLGGIGDDARDRNEPAVAIAAYRKALSVLPADAALQLNLGLALAQAGDPQAAVQAYVASLRANAQQPLAQINLGIAHERLGQEAEAERAFRTAMSIDPTAPLAYFNLGTGALRRGQSAEAVTWFEQALARDPGLAVGHFRLALALLREGRHAQAESAVRRSLALDSANAEAIELAAALREARLSPAERKP